MCEQAECLHIPRNVLKIAYLFIFNQLCWKPYVVAKFIPQNSHLDFYFEQPAVTLLTTR